MGGRSGKDSAWDSNTQAGRGRQRGNLAGRGVGGIYQGEGVIMQHSQLVHHTYILFFLFLVITLGEG